MLPADENEQRAKHVVLDLEHFRTAVQLRPPPPSVNRKPPKGGFLLLGVPQKLDSRRNQNPENFLPDVTTSFFALPDFSGCSRAKITWVKCLSGYGKLFPGNKSGSMQARFGGGQTQI